MTALRCVTLIDHRPAISVTQLSRDLPTEGQMARAISHTHHLDVSASAGRQASIRSPKSVFVFGLNGYTALGLCNNLTERGWCAGRERVLRLHGMHTEWRIQPVR